MAALLTLASGMAASPATGKAAVAAAGRRVNLLSSMPSTGHGLGHSDRHHDLADPVVGLGVVLERRPPSSPGACDGHVFNTSP
jgi:hypothetical protein